MAVFPAGRTRHDSVLVRPRVQAIHVVMAAGELNIVLLWGQPLGSVGPLLCRNSQIHRGKRDFPRRLPLFPPGKSNFHCWSSEIPRGRSDFYCGFRKFSAGHRISTTEFDDSRAGEAISPTGFHKSSGGKTISATGSRKSYAGEAISTTGFGKSCAGKAISTTAFHKSAIGKAISTADFTIPARENYFNQWILQILRRKRDFHHWISQIRHGKSDFHRWISQIDTGEDISSVGFPFSVDLFWKTAAPRIDWASPADIGDRLRDPVFSTTVSLDTLLSCAQRYRMGGLEALAQRPRRDRGQSRVITPILAQPIARPKRELKGSGSWVFLDFCQG